MTRRTANALLLLAGALWGMGFVAQATAMDAIGPMLFIATRFMVAAIAVLPFAMREASRSGVALGASIWRGFVLIGALLFASNSAQQVGLLTTTVTNSGFLTGIYVVLVPILSVILFRQWPHPVVWPASAITLGGIWLLSGAGSFELTTGDWLTILCAVFAALQVIMIGRLAEGTGRPVTLAVVQFATCSVLAWVAVLLFEKVDPAALMRALPEILYAGIFSGGIAFTIQAVGQRYTTPSQAAIMLASEAVFAAMFGVMLLSEMIPALGYAGCALILLAVLAVEIVPSRRAANAVTP